MGRLPGRDAKQTRAEILEAAIELFSKGGYVATSMSDLARAVGMTQGVLYFHFESKEALLVAAIDELEARLASKVANAAADLPTTRDISSLSRTLVERVAHIVEEDPRYFWFVGVIGAEAAGTNPRIEQGLRRAFTRVARLVETVLRQAMAEKLIDETIDVACTAQMFLGLYLGGIMQQRLFRKEFPLERARPVLVDLLHASLVPRRPPPRKKR
jgi:AcrR family transcriptional regulator